MSTWRPCDRGIRSGVEIWRRASEPNRADILPPRQNRAAGKRTAITGEYRPRWLRTERCAGQPQINIFIATGSEVELAVAATKNWTAEGVKARVVSMPSTDAFDKQDAAYRESVLPKLRRSLRVWRLKGIADYWFKYVVFERR